MTGSETRGEAKPPMAKRAALSKRVLAINGLAAVALVALIFGVLNAIRVTHGEVKASALLYMSPDCECCENYAAYLRNHGYAVTTLPTPNLSLIRHERGVLSKFAGCHTTVVNGFVVEGHVPVTALDKLLAERPKIRGISLPGMPDGSPGMTGSRSEPFTIYEISDGQADEPEKIYAIE